MRPDVNDTIVKYRLYVCMYFFFPFFDRRLTEKKGGVFNSEA